MHFRYSNVCLEAICCELPDEIVTSSEIESRLAPLYRRLRLPEGRLALMSGIDERRFWPVGTMPSEMSIRVGRRVLASASVDPQTIGALVHGSVSRDFIEPATAAGVHHGLKLSPDCLLYDVSNACLGLLNGMVQVANMIELGQIRAGLVLGAESGRELVETTIKALNADETLSRNDIKSAFASLTIGSAAAAVLLVDRELSRTQNRLIGGVASAATDHCELCQGGHNQTQGAAGLLMNTDSETLMQQGVAAAQTTFDRFCRHLDWQPSQIDKTFCHQVGRAHRRLLLDTLGLRPEIDYTTFPWLGNTGSVALPTTAALGIENHHLAAGDRVALLGIGSGINVLMLALQWESQIPKSPNL